MTLLPAPFQRGESLVSHQRPDNGSHVSDGLSTTSTRDGADLITLTLPAIFQVKEDNLRVAKPVACCETEFLEQDLDVTRLNRLHKHLWLAGLPQPPRPLHNQLEIGREIRITERADMHMLWHGTTLYVKPLPEYLLCFAIWEEHLCKDERLHASAMGLLLSYVWLIMRASDHRMAVDRGLLRSEITWPKWAAFVSSLTSGGIIDGNVNPRYRFGELRLTRIHWAYRLCARGGRLDDSIIRGYYYSYQDYSTFASRNLAWMLTAFLYAALVLTAMQTGLSTEHLAGSPAFQKASWGFVVFTIISPIAVVAAVFLFIVLLVIKNLVFARQRKGRPAVNDAVWRSSALVEYKH